MNGQDRQPPSDGEANDGSLPTYMFIASILLWVALIRLLGDFWQENDGAGDYVWMLLPSASWALATIALGLHAGRPTEVKWALALLPIAAFATLPLLLLGAILLGSVLPESERRNAAYVLGLLCIPALATAWLRHRTRLLEPPISRRLFVAARRALGLLEILAMIAAISGLGLWMVTPSHGPPPIRSRVMELVLAASPVKAALAEGMQMYGTWSQAWMSSITISTTGVVASATVGPTGQITVWGTAATSGAVVTVTPNTTTDNKLVWTCTGSPVKYMPASCR